MINIKIRDAVSDDAAGVARVRIETWRSAYRDLMPAEILAGLDFEKERLRLQETLAHPIPDRHLFVAEAADLGVVGFCWVGPNSEPEPPLSGELNAIYILPEVQGQGVGKRLVQAAVEWMMAHHYDQFYLWVLHDNLPARRFYESLGGLMVGQQMVTIRGTDLTEVRYSFQTKNILGRH